MKRMNVLFEQKGWKAAFYHFEVLIGPFLGQWEPAIDTLQLLK